MKIRRQKKNGFFENCASSDIAFLLIIYFLVIAGFNINQGFLVDLPAPEATRVVQRDALLRFELDGDGRIFFRETELSLAAAEREIREAVAANSDVAVVLSIDPGTPWQQVVSFVELSQKLAVEAFSFGMRAVRDE